MSGYTIVSLCQDTQLCLGLVSVCSNIFHFFHFLKLFSFTFYFPSLKFSRCLAQKITSRYTIVWFVWRVHYCVQLLSWGHDFLILSIISFTFDFHFLMYIYTRLIYCRLNLHLYDCMFCFAINVPLNPSHDLRKTGLGTQTASSFQTEWTRDSLVIWICWNIPNKNMKGTYGTPMCT